MQLTGLGAIAGTHEKNSSVPFLKSKGFLGSISGVDRARVMELVNPEPDRPLAAHFRAACLRSALFLVIVDLSKNVLKHIQKTNWSDFPWHLLHISLGPTARHSSLQGHHPEAFGWCC